MPAMPKKESNTETPQRPTQPKCESCNHAISFHRGGTDRCFVVGCECKKWKKPKVKK